MIARSAAAALAALRRPDARCLAAVARRAGQVRAGWVRLCGRLIPGAPDGEAKALLYLSVSESGWQATLHPADGSGVIETAERAVADEAPVSTPDMLRRAVRAISPATRDGIGGIRLLILDRAAAIVDNRVLKPRGLDPVAIRQAGAQELGSAGAVHAFQPFGSSSEHEIERGVYAFLSAERIRDYLGAMDSLAVKLNAVVPSSLLCLQLQRQPFAAIEVRAAGATLVLGDPDSGAVACRELSVGTRDFAEAISRATSVSVREAAEGLERRSCLVSGSIATGAPSTTELAVAPLLAALRDELLATLEYFTFQRLAGEPECLLVGGDVARVRGLAEWLGGVLGLAPQPAPEPGQVMAAANSADAGTQDLNLLLDTPAGLLRIGRTDYRFTEGRFRPIQIQARPARRPHASLRGLAGQKLSLSVLRQTVLALAALFGPGAAAAALVMAIGGGAGWATISGGSDAALQAEARLSQRLADDTVLRHAVLHPRGPLPAPSPSQPWFEKLSRVAALIPDGVRLTALTTLPDPAAPVRQRVVLEGAVPAAPGEDYIARIAGFMDRLETDPVFMKDVASIGFDGASLVQGPPPNVADFTISVVLAPSFAAPPAVVTAAGVPG